jgi:hypothetical protein
MNIRETSSIINYFHQVARNLHDCLALASFKAQNGWQDRPLRAIEPEVTERLKRKRPYSSGDILSDSSSDHSGHRFYGSSPSSAHILSDDTSHSTVSGRHYSKAPSHFDRAAEFASRKRYRSNSSASNLDNSTRHVSWKQNHKLPQSSPVGRHQFSSTQPPLPPFVSDSATIPEPTIEHSPIFDIQNASDDDDADLPVHSFHYSTANSMILSSPPRTPPPQRTARAGHSKQVGADLLLFLANSPSRSPPVDKARLPHTSVQPPSTPPSQHSQLPSSVLNTPGVNHSLFNAALNTPGQGFNFADFVNITPSPAQLPWGGRTPGHCKTPAASKAARRSLNFDSLAPPTSDSPSQQRNTPTTQGLALQLGDELVPRK